MSNEDIIYDHIKSAMDIATEKQEQSRLDMTDEQRLQIITEQLLIVRDNLFRGMSKSIQKLQARSINEVLALENFTQSPQRTWVGLTDEDLAVCGDEDDVMLARYWERVCKEKNK